MCKPFLLKLRRKKQTGVAHKAMQNFQISMNKKDKYSFKKGFLQVRQKDADEVRGLIMRALGINNRISWSKRLNGHIEPKVSEAMEIEAIFRRFGIKDVWGEE